MDVNYGVAAASTSVDTEVLLQDYGMQIICAVAPLNTLTPAYFVPVEFWVPTTSLTVAAVVAQLQNSATAR